MEHQDSEKREIKMFEDYNLNLELLRGLYSLGYEEPTKIQKKILASLLLSKDIIVKTSSMTGKNISFIIYSLQIISQSKKDNVLCLILTHTRDMVQKIYNIYKEISKFMNEIRIHALLGGTIKDDITRLSGGVQIVIGTPGRVNDAVNRKILSLNELKFLVIDDLKQIIERDFTNMVSSIVSNINNEKCQKAIFINNNDNNMNYDDNILNGIFSDNMKKMIKIKEGTEILDNSNIYKDKLSKYKIYQISLKEEWKFDILLNIYKLMEISQAIIFCNSERSADILNKNLSGKDFICNYTYDDKSKNIINFKNGNIRIIVTSDEVSAKEVDLYNKSIIINYEVPNNLDKYVERVGRNEFFGKEGTIINFVTEYDKKFNRELELYLGNKVNELPIELSNIQI